MAKKNNNKNKAAPAPKWKLSEVSKNPSVFVKGGFRNASAHPTLIFKKRAGPNANMHATLVWNSNANKYMPHMTLGNFHYGIRPNRNFTGKPEYWPFKPQGRNMTKAYENVRKAVAAKRYPSYKKGGRVPKSGLYRLHKGEVVVPSHRVKAVDKALKKAGLGPLKKK